MFKTTEELKEFLIWAKSQGIESVKAKGMEVKFAAHATLPAEFLKEITNGDATLTDTEPLDKREEEELRYWSSNS